MLGCPWLFYQLVLSVIFIFGPFLLLYINVPDWNRLENRNGVIKDYPERWQKLVMIVPTVFGILSLYVLIHGKLAMEEIREEKRKKKTDPEKMDTKKQQPVYGAPNITVITAPSPAHYRERVSEERKPSEPPPLPEPSAPPKVID